MNSEEISDMEFHSNTGRFRKGVSIMALILAMLLFTFAASAQNLVRITTSVLPPYSPYIQDYPGTGNRVQIFISNLSRTPLTVRLLGKLEGDNGVVIRTSANYRPVRPLQLLATDVNRALTRAELEGLFDLNQIEVQGMDKNLLYRGLPLPEGNYQLCVQAFDNATTRPLSAEFPMGCSGLIPIRVIEPPILIAPMADAEVNSNIPQTQLFTWTAPVGILPNQVEYTLRIIELPQTGADPNVFIDAVVLPKSGIEVKNLKTTTFLYGPQHPPLQVGKRYAWRVQAVPLNARFNILNEGKSPVQAFTYGKLPIAGIPGIEVAQTPFSTIPGMGDAVDTTGGKKVMYAYKMPANCACKVPVNENDQVDNSQVLKSRKATIAGFQMELLANVKEQDGKLSGTGMIPVPMINNSYVKLRVNLFDVQCNAGGQVIGGFVRAIYKDGAPGYTPDYDKPEMPALEMSPATMQNLSNFFTTAKDQLVSSLTNSAKSVGFELPLGIDKSFGPINTVIAITNMTFMPNQAFFDANTWVKTANAMVSGIPLSGYNMCFTPEKPCGEGILYLADKMQLSPFFALKGAEGAPSQGPFGGPDTTVVTHVVFDENGFKQMRVHGLLTPPGLVDAQTNGQAEISINAGLVNFQNWTAQLSFPKFYVAGLQDFKFSMQPGKPAIYDHSETVTPATLPEGYLSPAEVNLWQGLYFPEIDLELPPFIKRADGKQLTVGVKNMISDNNGFSGKALIKNILDIGDGSLASWYYSIDELSVSFLKSAFQSSQMTGKLVLPIFNDSDKVASQIPYECTLSKDEQAGGISVQFVAKPTDEMNVDIWRAQLSLTNSSVTATYTSNQGVEARAQLSGSMNIDATYFTIPAAKFEGMVLSTKAPYFDVKDFKLGFASPQKMVDDFPLTLESGGIVTDPSDPLRFGFKFMGGIDLTSQPGAPLTASAAATVFFKTGLANGRPSWAFDKVQADSVAIDAVLGPVAVKGRLAFYENQSVYGNGLAGDVEMTVTGLLGGKVAARFGKTLPGSGAFKYWYVGGKITIGGAGIPLAPPLPLSLRSFGGGLYSHAARKVAQDGNVTYVPDEQTKFGFEALMGVGLTTPDVLTMEGTIGLEITEGGGLGSLSYHVDAWLLGNTKEAAFAKGTGDMSFDFQNKVFDAQLSLGASYKLPGVNISAAAEATRLYVDGNSGNWFVTMGVPGDRVDLTVDIASLAKFTFGSYFMLGNYNPTGTQLPPAPYGFQNRPGILSELGYKGTASQVFKSNAPMVAFGSGYSMKSDFGVGPFHLRYDGAVGYDLALTQTNDKCNGITPGLNSWYAMGQIYAYMHFALDLDIDTWVYEGTLTVVELEAAALLRGGMVNPIWLNGHVLLRYRVLGGLVKGRVNLDFWYNKGERCEPTFAPPNPFAGQPLIASLGPSGTDDAVSILSPYYAEFNYPVQSDLIIDIEIPQGQEVEAGTQGTVTKGTQNQSILHREFQLVYLNGFTTKATQIDPQYAACTADNSGRLSYGRNEDGDPNYNATYYRYNALLPNSTYQISLDLQVQIRDKGKLVPYLFKDQHVEQKETVTFKTGPCISVLSKGSGTDDAITTSYPYEGQRYFMKGENAPTFIKLKTNMSCCMSNLNSDDNFDLKARFTPLEGTSFADNNTAAVLLTDAVFKGDRVDYNLPAGIKNRMLYRFELVRIPKPNFVKTQFAAAQKAKENAKKIVSANIYKAVNSPGFKAAEQQLLKANSKTGMPGAGSANGPAVNSKYNNHFDQYTEITEDAYEVVANTYGTSYKINAATEKLYTTGSFMIKVDPELVKKQKEEAAFGKSLEMKMYRYYFKTSQYNTLAEKLAAASFPQSESSPWAKMVDALTTKMVSPEGYDTYELASEYLGGDNVRPPLLLLKADPSSFWFKDIAVPVAELIGLMPGSFYDEAGKSKPFPAATDAISTFQRSMASFNNEYDDIQKPFKNEDIMKLIPSEKKKNK